MASPRWEASTWFMYATKRAGGSSTRLVFSKGREIAMKVVAMKNDPSRTYQDLADIRFLLTLNHVDREHVRAQFEKHGLLERYHEFEAS